MDFLVFKIINGLAGKWVWLDKLAIFFAKYFGWILILSLILFLLKNFKKNLKPLLKIILAALFSRFVVAELIRFFWYRPRPFLITGTNLLITHSATASFPSGHAVFFFTLATGVYFLNKKAGISFFIAGALIGISRIFCGIHWPSDILAGALIGIFSALLIKKYLEAARRRREIRD